MKKYFIYAVALAATMSLTSCISEEDINLEQQQVGYISLNVSADNELSTRATQNVTGTAVEKWYAVVNNGTKDVYGEAGTKKLIGTELASTAFAEGTYSVKVSNYANEEGAYANTVNSGFGDAYYEGEATGQEVKKAATTEVSIDCKTAKNAKFKINSSDFSGTLTSVAITATSHDVTFSNSDNTLSNDAYFKAKEELSYTITYNINGSADKTHKGEFTLGGAATLNTLTIKSNSNGTISIITIKYDDDFQTGEKNEVEIDAATGDIVTPTNP